MEQPGWRRRARQAVAGDVEQRPGMEQAEAGGHHRAGGELLGERLAGGRLRLLDRHGGRGPVVGHGRRGEGRPTDEIGPGAVVGGREPCRAGGESPGDGLQAPGGRGVVRLDVIRHGVIRGCVIRNG